MPQSQFGSGRVREYAIRPRPRHRLPQIAVWAAALAALWLTWVTVRQRGELEPNAGATQPRNSSLDALPGGPDDFRFVRVQYDSSGGYGEAWYRHEGRTWQRWETDYPNGEENLLSRLNQLTAMRVEPEPIAMRLTDERLTDHPFIFMSDIGWQVLSAAEAQALDHYLSVGGFLWIDDFWGQAEWENLERNTLKLGKNWSWRRIPADHPIMNCVYPIDECPQIPARIFYQSTGLPYDPPQVHRFPSGGIAGVRQVNFMGLFDAQERLAAVATHNTDIADGWEREGESRDYFLRFSIDSYAMAINIITYAMSH